MKTLILLIPILLIATFSTAQDFDHIIYKQECDVAYKLTFEKKKFEKSNAVLEEIEKKYGILYGEEEFLRAYNWKLLGDTLKASNCLATAWKGEFFDFKIIWESDKLNALEISKGFNEECMKIITDSWENPKYYDYCLEDSLKKVREEMDLLDQSMRLVKTKSLSEEELSNYHRQFIYNDSLNIRRFQEIIKVHGYPGPKIFPKNSGEFSTLLIHSSYYDWAFEELKPLLLEEVRAGRMAPSSYVLWLEKHNQEFNLPLEYGIIGTPDQFDLTDPQKEVVLQKRLALGLVSHYPIPSLGLSF